MRNVEQSAENDVFRVFECSKKNSLLKRLKCHVTRLTYVLTPLQIGKDFTQCEGIFKLKFKNTFFIETDVPSLYCKPFNVYRS